MDNFFYKKFRNKTDKELQQILVEKETYTLEATTTAYKILKERNISIEGFTAIEEELKKYESSKENQFENFKDDNSTLPELYSKKTILGFSIFFSTIFGVILLLINMHQVNNQKGKNQVLLFGISYLILTIIIVQIFKTSSILGLLFNLLGATILNEYYWNNFIGKDVTFKKRNWLKPALLSLSIITIVFIVSFSILR